MRVKGTPRAWAAMSAIMLDFPISIEPPATAAAVAAPLFIRVSRISRPALRNSPALCAYRTGVTSSSAAEATRTTARSAAATLGAAAAAANPITTSRRFNASSLSHVEVHAFDVGQVESAERTLLQQTQPSFALVAGPELPRPQARVAQQLLHLALERGDTLHLETDVIGHLPRHEQQRHAAVRYVIIVVSGAAFEPQVEHLGIETRATLRVADADRQMIEGPALLPFALGIAVLLHADPALRQIEDVHLGIVGAVGRERPPRRPLDGLDRRIEAGDLFEDALEVVDLDPEVIDTAARTLVPDVVVEAEIAVLEDDRAGRPRFARRTQAEERFVELSVDRVDVAADRDVIDARGHRSECPSFQRRPSACGRTAPYGVNRLTPVIAAGVGRPMSGRSVGAISPSFPGLSRPSGSRETMTSGTGFVVCAVNGFPCGSIFSSAFP